ncbi:hypothetical protein TNCV_2552451 [Trichonephila clavipes]|nr:hypothetical protein TNCV_2552451 [Trichonephila clavipes]
MRILEVLLGSFTFLPEPLQLRSRKYIPMRDNILSKSIHSPPIEYFLLFCTLFSQEEMVQELVRYQRSSSFALESIPDWTPRHLRSKASRPLTSLDPANSDVTGAEFPRQSPVSKSTE